MITEFYKFLDEWNRILGFKTPQHHRQIMRFLVEVWMDAQHRGLLILENRQLWVCSRHVCCICILKHEY